MPPGDGREGRESGEHEPRDARPRSDADPTKTSSESDNRDKTGGKNQRDQGGDDPSSRSEREGLSPNDPGDHDPYEFDHDTNLDPFSTGGGYEEGKGPPPEDPPTGPTLDEIAAELRQESEKSLAEYQAKVEAWNQKVWGETLSLSQSSE